MKETKALFNTLESLLSSTHNARIDAFVDKSLLYSWERQVSKSSAISDILKDMFSFTMSRNLSLNLMYVLSKDNPADAPSQSLSDLDCSLSLAAWHQVDTAFGPHTIDLMALPFNVQADRAGRPLRFFAPLPCPQAAGINVFAQDISPDENAYVFPPFVLIGPLLKYLSSQGCAFSIVVPDLCPRKFNEVPRVLSNWDPKETPVFYCSRPSLVFPCGSLVLCSGIFGYFVSRPFESISVPPRTLRTFSFVCS